MITINDCRQANQHKFKGLFLDTRPVNCAVNSLFFQLNGAIFYFFDKSEELTGTSNWRRVGG